MRPPDRIYLDHNASAPLRPEARVAMCACLDSPANASSAHREGSLARRRLEDARAHVAALIGARPAEIIFTSGATEANNLALRGLVRPPGAIITSAIEHASVLETARSLGETRTVGVDATGRLNIEAVADASRNGGSLVSVGFANGEVGVVAPIAALAERIGPTGVVLHTDAAQAAGRLPINVATLGVDALSLSSHKIGGPLGAGALWIRAGQRLTAQLSGGPQERERRAGTENVPALVGFGAAAAVVGQQLAAERAVMQRRRDALWDRLRATVPNMTLNGPHDEPRLPNVLNLTFEGCTGESLLVRLDLAGVAVSLGSACAAGAAAPSHVLLAMGRDLDAARSGIRFSLGPTTSDADIAQAALVVAEAVAAVRRRAAA